MFDPTVWPLFRSAVCHNAFSWWWPSSDLTGIAVLAPFTSLYLHLFHPTLSQICLVKPSGVSAS